MSDVDIPLPEVPSLDLSELMSFTPSSPQTTSPASEPTPDDDPTSSDDRDAPEPPGDADGTISRFERALGMIPGLPMPEPEEARAARSTPPVVEEPLVAQPVVEQPVVEQAIVEEPVVEEPFVERAIVEESVVEQAIVEEPVVAAAAAPSPAPEVPQVVESPPVETSAAIAVPRLPSEGGSPAIQAPAAAPADTGGPVPGGPIAGVGDRSKIPVVEPRGLIFHTPLRAIMVIFNLAALPLAIGAARLDEQHEYAELLARAAVGSAAISFLILVMWSAIAAVNAKRVRSQSKHLERPTAIRAASTWFLAPAVAAGGVIAASYWIERSDPSAEVISRETIEDGLVPIPALAIFGLLVVIAGFWPYGVLSRVSRCVGGTPNRFPKWFFAPIFGLAVSVLVVVGSDRLGIDDDGSFPSALYYLGVLVVVTLPWILWLLAGNRAMGDVEEATKGLHASAVAQYRLALGDDAEA